MRQRGVNLFGSLNGECGQTEQMNIAAEMTYKKSFCLQTLKSMTIV
jgi:hypothetical protein